MSDALHDRRVQTAALALATAALFGRFLDPTVGVIALAGVVPGVVNAPRADPMTRRSISLHCPPRLAPSGTASS